MKAEILSEMRDISSWEDEDCRKSFLAKQLTLGRLSLVLGAGVSINYGLPDWASLTNRMLRAAGTGRRKDESLEGAAARILRDHCDRDKIAFARLVRDALYKGVRMDFEFLQRKPMLTAVSSIALGSTRGRAASVVTFNFDELLERYLEFLGFSVGTVNRPSQWRSQDDVVVWHVHGLLHKDKSRAIRRGIVFVEEDYDRVVGDAKDLWRIALVKMWTETTCLFVGLSGDDANLRSILDEVKGRHCSRKERHPFWGVRIALTRDPRADMWRDKGVFHHPVLRHDLVPRELFGFAQVATKLVKQD